MSTQDDTRSVTLIIDDKLNYFILLSYNYRVRHISFCYRSQASHCRRLTATTCSSGSWLRLLSADTVAILPYQLTIEQKSVLIVGSSYQGVSPYRGSVSLYFPYLNLQENLIKFIFIKQLPFAPFLKQEVVLIEILRQYET